MITDRLIEAVTPTERTRKAVTLVDFGADEGELQVYWPPDNETPMFKVTGYTTPWFSLAQAEMLRDSLREYLGE